MKPLAFLALLSFCAAPAPAQELNAAVGAESSQSIDTLKKKYGAGAQAREFSSGGAAGTAAPKEALAAWSRECPDIAVYLASKTSGSAKKGVGVTSEYAGGPALISFVRPAWYYTWSANAVNGAAAEFVPLLQFPRSPNAEELLRKELGALPPSTKRFLGFNEPDIPYKYKKDGQEMVVPPLPVPSAEEMRDRLMAMIPRSVEKGLELGSPALASPVLGQEPAGWLQDYMKDSEQKLAASPDGRTDFIAVHLYSSIAIADEDTPQQAYEKVKLAARGFAARLAVLEKAYPSKKFWITEMGLMDRSAKDTHHPLFTAKDDACFMAQTLSVLDGDAKVARYAWFSADPQAKNPLYPTLPGALLSEGRPTPLAELYR